MRVITGLAKGRRLNAPAGTHTRPTSELVKEAAFSVIQFEIGGANVLDLFAGSGQMGIEALSRGAKSCVFIDTSKASRAVISENLKHTGFLDKAKVVGMDAAAYVSSVSGPIDIAFLDPPYRMADFDKLLPPLGAAMGDSGVILCETEKSEVLPESAGKLAKYREYRYGKTKITVYRNTEEL